MLRVQTGLGSPSSRQAESSSLPWADELQEALGSLYRILRSPLEYDSTPFITQLMQVPSCCSSVVTIAAGSSLAIQRSHRQSDCISQCHNSCRVRLLKRCLPCMLLDLVTDTEHVYNRSTLLSCSGATGSMSPQTSMPTTMRAGQAAGQSQTPA